MKIYVDADACPVISIIEDLAKKYDIPCTLLCDTNHVIGPSERTSEDDKLFAESFERLICHALHPKSDQNKYN